jgi:hypothetical protein
MQSLSTRGTPPSPRHSRRRRLAAMGAWGCAIASAVRLFAACNDTPGPSTGPGDIVVNDTNQDAVRQLTQDTGAQDVIAPMGVGSDGGYPDTGGYASDAPMASTGYLDAGSPQTACASCTCGEHRGFCLENGVSATVSAPATSAGLCGLASATTLAVGCNPIPDSCPTPTCECILNAIMPPLGCYPQCTSSAGYFDVYCTTP